MKLSRGQKQSVTVLFLLTVLNVANIFWTESSESKKLTVGFFVDGDVLPKMSYENEGSSYTIYDLADDTAAEIGADIEYVGGITGEDYGEWLAAAYVKDKEPDVFLILPEDLALYMRIGALAELPATTKFVADGDGSALPVSVRQNDKIFAVPFGKNFVGVSSRSAHVKSAQKFLSAFVENMNERRL